MVVSSGVVWIVDQSVVPNQRNPFPSITNDAIAVVEHVLYHYPKRRIIYRDSMGRWDELCHDGLKFICFRPGHDGLELPEVLR